MKNLSKKIALFVQNFKDTRLLQENFSQPVHLMGYKFDRVVYKKSQKISMKRSKVQKLDIPK